MSTPLPEYLDVIGLEEILKRLDLNRLKFCDNLVPAVPSPVTGIPATPVTNRIAYSPTLKRAVIVGGVLNDGLALWSDDLITWNRTTIGQFIWNSVCWSPELERFVAVGGRTSAAGSGASWSEDGIVWTPATFPDTTARTWTDVIWNHIEKMFIAVGTTTPFNMMSSTGAVWTNGVATNQAANNVIWLNDDWIMTAGANTGCRRRQQLGASWSTAATLVNPTTGLAWTPNYGGPNGRWVAVGTSDIRTSDDNGVTWTIRYGPSILAANNFTLQRVIRVEELDLFIAFSSGSNATGLQLISDNGGETWSTVRLANASSTFRAGCWIDHLSVVAALSTAPFHGSNIKVSSTGRLWGNTIFDGGFSGLGNNNCAARADHTHPIFDFTNPLSTGTVNPGVANIAARRDHVHPVHTATVSSRGGVILSSTGTATGASIVDNTARSSGAVSYCHVVGPVSVALNTFRSSGEWVWSLVNNANADQFPDDYGLTGAATAIEEPVNACYLKVLRFSGATHITQILWKQGTFTFWKRISTSATEWGPWEIALGGGESLELATSAPPLTTITGTSVLGVSLTAARADHTHGINFGPAGPSVTLGGPLPSEGFSEGVAQFPARRDHSHGYSVAAPVNVGQATAANNTNHQGTAVTLALSDHRHALLFDSVAPAALGAAAAAGTQTVPARRDHVHARPSLADLGAAASDHNHDTRYPRMDAAAVLTTAQARRLLANMATAAAIGTDTVFTADMQTRLRDALNAAPMNHAWNPGVTAVTNTHGLATSLLAGHVRLSSNYGDGATGNLSTSPQLRAAAVAYEQLAEIAGPNLNNYRRHGEWTFVNITGTPVGFPTTALADWNNGCHLTVIKYTGETHGTQILRRRDRVTTAFSTARIMPVETWVRHFNGAAAFSQWQRIDDSVTTQFGGANRANATTAPTDAHIQHIRFWVGSMAQAPPIGSRDSRTVYICTQ